ncbi:MAG: PHB depolymerase family esterase [Oligoflexia bacterium]|nr:PHB depolymerase family esterase [Oligoflexia bacterium]
MFLAVIAALFTVSPSASAGPIWCVPFLNCDSDSGDSTFSAASLPGNWSQGSFKDQNGHRSYYLYIPQNKPTGALPLVLALHGCTEAAPNFAAQSGLNDVAEKYGFAIVYPQETQDDNQMKCWNWFDPANQVRGGGEMDIAMGIINQVSSQIQIDTSRVYVAGFSSGAAMASNLLACYSDVFAGGFIHSGLEYAAASSTMDAFSAQSSGSQVSPTTSGHHAAKCTGSGAKLENILILHGSSDSIVNPVNSTQVLKQFTQMNNDLDPTQTDKVVGTQSYTVPGGYKYTMNSYGGTSGIHIVSVTVDGMDHAWSGAHKNGPYMDPKGPDASEMMWQFFNRSGASSQAP